METNPISCKLKIPKNLDEKTPCFLVDFTNGNLNLQHSNKLKFTCYRRESDKNNASAASRVLIANSGHLNYESRSNVNNDQNTFNYFVGVRSKSSRKMKIFEALPFHLKPVLNNKMQIVSPQLKNYRERTEDLDMNFGSKGKKRTIAARQRYSVGSTSLNDALEDISLDSSVDNENRSSVSNSSASIDYLPPQNCDAQTVDQVYNVSDIISTVEDEHLDSRADELLQDLPSHLNRWKIDGTFCEYVVNHLEDKDLIHVKAKYLLYYNYLVIFSKLLSTDMKKKDPAPQIPEPIRSYILDRFTVSSTSRYNKVMRSFPLKMKDKLLAYILVLALIIDNYTVNLSLVQKGTKYGIPKITSIAQALGCYIRRQSIDNCVMPFAELKLPLFVLQKFKKF